MVLVLSQTGLRHLWCELFEPRVSAFCIAINPSRIDDPAGGAQPAKQRLVWKLGPQLPVDQRDEAFRIALRYGEAVVRIQSRCNARRHRFRPANSEPRRK